MAYEIVLWPTASINYPDPIKFVKIAFNGYEVSLLGRQTAYSYVSEDTTSLVLLREMVLEITAIPSKLE